ncbi:prostaglandin E2 receptor EP4 subtype-like isoform X1 [Mizuhopecten yessoensis]|uniref:Thromboxane A2 receptor n=1 Tax=Mizuhopecten yessoensis TaxID=6573 RepID=A0A210R5M9_MIZYE|nr:prostaglandin E2 receptor EP4 subtype-like isoform X1 [Mizuhopecten yessoensis]XP_021351618.1 prostaglandin E2 receptor EP4 subtype-like isoform X1 [Mizuhopecten yessoensis]XP_021351627.1 prostaglandin E2 receptor EP4 subtype-like isoform X1 [Mizuhopecten yessoensis]XP_021351636.1 prostaglandin E2 receptor EP4 subtype-like isoform X1 [Mizuhopecten yessoensis]OWF56349.1 Prostaglandin E2 receptor EP4 subtype [Mizuhopecten yessoensis]
MATSTTYDWITTEHSIVATDLPQYILNLTLNSANLTTTNATNVTLPTIGRKVSPTSTAIQFTFGVIGNLLAIFVLVRSAKSHKWRVFYRLVGALAVTDLFGIVATSPVAFIVYANNLRWVGGQPLCDYLSFMLIFAGLATVFIVAAMSLDRFVAVWFPYSYSVTMKKASLVNLAVVSLWIVSISIAFLPLIGLGQNVLQFPGTWCFFNFFGTDIKDKCFAYFYATIGIIMILLTAILNSLVILMLAKANRQNGVRRKASSVGSRSGKSRRNDVFIMIFLVVLMVVFATCWTPLMVRIIINQSGAYPVDHLSDLMAVRLASINQILDPWVYILFRKEFLNRLLRFGKRHTNAGSLFHRLASTRSRTGSERSMTDDVFEHPVTDCGEVLLESSEKTDKIKSNGVNGDIKESVA